MQAYMADQLSPILGDQFFSYRVKNLMGHPTAVSHLHTPGELKSDWIKLNSIEIPSFLNSQIRCVTSGSKCF